MCGQGEGVAYRGRALVELQTTLGEIPEIPVSDIDSGDVLRVQVSSQQQICEMVSVCPVQL